MSFSIQTLLGLLWLVGFVACSGGGLRTDGSTGDSDGSVTADGGATAEGGTTSDGGGKPRRDASPLADTTPPDALAPDKAIPYKRITINFDDVPSGTTITTQYKQHATFSSAQGCSLVTSTSAGAAASKPNYVWTYYSCSGATKGSKAPYFIDFSKPVRHVAFTLVGVNSSSKVATLRLVHAQPGKGPTVSDVIGLGSYQKPVVVDLPQSADVVRVEIVDVSDAYGLGLDDVQFDFPG
jgi:hypothetical protein